MCAIASTTCFLTFFFFGSAKFESSFNYSVGAKIKNRSIVQPVQMSIRQFATHSAMFRSHSTYRLIGRRGPFRVRAFVRVRWPRNGSPRLWRIPR